MTKLCKKCQTSEAVAGYGDCCVLCADIEFGEEKPGLPADLVNGYPVLASFQTPARPGTVAGRVVLVDRRADYDYEGFVTWWQSAETGACCDGHYHSARWQAEKDFLERCARG